ncbi:MAG: GH32 C-terminal domain-containing protein [Planctomycetota bacterium]|jgi:sucrose-6-phosphate hydrolase SacC (GH32 family)
MVLSAVASTVLVTGSALGEQASADPKQPDYTSKVPKFVFADTLEEQEAQLRTNPLIKRFAKSRLEMAGDRYRPIYHYVNPESSLNDGNGLCFWKGRWHLFYQAYPPEDTRQHWGHAVGDKEPLKLRVFVDRSVVEVFVNGKQCVAVRVYPGREDSTGVSLRSQGQDATLKSLDAWQMKNIYE